MALKNMSTAAMISLTKPWVTGGHPERELLLSFEETKALLGRVGMAHEGLLNVQPRSDGRLAVLSGRQTELDVRHDDLVRAIHGLLTHLALAERAPEARQRLSTLRDELLPTGLSLVQRSYRDEAGEGALLRARLSATQKKALRAIPLPNGTLADLVQEYLETAEALGTLEDEKAVLAQKSSGPSAAEVLNVRNVWIRTVNALLGLLDLVPIDAAAKASLLARVERATRTGPRGNGAEDEGAERPEESPGVVETTAPPPVVAPSPVG